jgi:hypothetical protein
MNPTTVAIAFAVVFVSGPHAYAATAPDLPPDDEVEISMDQGNATTPTSEAEKICFFSGKPPSDVSYVIVKKIKIGKGTYGSVTDILPKFAEYATRIGANAVIDYTGSQRFGFWPWRMVHPVVRGEAVKWSGAPKLDCAQMGGSTLEMILATNKAPPKK